MSGSGQPVEVARDMAAAPDTVYGLVSDVTRMGEWSPETTACEWIKGATGPVVGARFRGRNQIGWRRWSTTCTVTAADPGQRFAFRVASVGGLPVGDWSFVLEPTAQGSRVTESFVDRRGRLIIALGRLVTGVNDRADHNRQTMAITLDRVAQAAST